MILGLAAAITPVNIKEAFLKREVTISAMATLVFAIFINDIRIDGTATSFVSRSEGLILIILLGFFLYYLFQSSKGQKKSDEKIQILPLWKSILRIGLGLGGLIVGGDWIVK